MPAFRHGWRLADAQLASTHITTALAVDFDPMDVPRDRFLVAGAALRLTASSAADPGPSVFRYPTGCSPGSGS
ncbi:hypothetical protein [Actinomadura bangladeshensis]|uniref:hypothetical protein n=1 Tax=Actinomadura bangladeshensis TaxID=453573 RepID=UPI001EF3B164|nr:hypothetical protein [Actinomadura bangladeshensis]